MLRKNVASQFVHIAGVNASTGAIVTGATWTMRRCLDGTFAAGGATVTEDGTTGFYKVALAQADTNGNDIGYFFTATNCVPVTINVVTTAADPTDSVRFGLTALPNAAAEAAGGIYTRGTGAGQINQPANGMIDANTVRNAGTAITATAGFQRVLLADRTDQGGTSMLITGERLVFASTTNNEPGWKVTGNSAGSAVHLYGGTGGGAGLKLIGGDNFGSGLQSLGGSSGGHGAVLTNAVGNYSGLVLQTAGGTASVVTIVQQGTGDGVTITPGTGGDAIVVAGPFIATDAGNDIRGVDVEDSVWDAVLANHLDAGSTGEALNAAGAAGDPWITALPGAYGAGSAGFIVGNSLGSFTFPLTVPGALPVNVTYMNDTQVLGTGVAGDLWRG